MNFPHLFTPGKIGTLAMPNRIIMGSMHLGYEGLPGGGERIAEFYAARARGGASLIITGGCAINAEAIGGMNFSCIYRDEDLYTLAQIAKRTHEEGGRIGLQLFHAGRYAKKEWLSGLQPVAPSAIRCTLHPTTPRAFTSGDIERTIDDFARAAIRAREAGMDAVEIMGSEGYLINQFLSPLTNRREDEWGGGIENRARFGVEVMRAVRAACGPEFPIIMRMSGIDLMPGSNGWEETFYFAQAVTEAGADALNIGIGWHESRLPTISMLVPRAYYSFVSERIKKHVTIPCILSNRVNDPAVAEKVLAEQKADFISMARPLLAVPDLVVKAANQRSEFINTCIACNQACLDNAFIHQPTTCILNPQAGREAETKLAPALHKKRVAVVGAGPAGLEASKVLAQRGHHVTLFEKQNRIGGQLLFAVQVPGKQEFYGTLRYYQSYLNELQVRQELGTSVDAASLKEFDVVIVASGARPNLPQVEGMERTGCMDYETFFRTRNGIGKSIVVMGAGGIGCDVAHLLSASEGSYPPPSFFDDPNHVEFYEDHIRALPREKNVALTRRGKRIGEKLGATTRWALIQLLENRGVQMMTQIQYQRVTTEGLHLRTRSGKDILLPADTIVFATGQIPDNSLYQEIKPVVEQSYLIGAAEKASETNAMRAIWDAFEVARKI